LPVGLEGLRVISFESRRAAEMAEIVRRYGGEAILAPSMREVPLVMNAAAFEFVQRLEAGAIDVVIFLTGVGARTLSEVVASQYPKEKFAQLLGRARLVARGPKPVTALKELGLQPAITVPEPNTWREILATLDTAASVSGKRIAVQEYGATNSELISGLKTRGAEVMRVPVYRWALPEDLGPLESAVEKILAREIDIALFTNAMQVQHLFSVAGDDRREALQQSLTRLLVASIGPVCSEALEHYGIKPDLEPDLAKMGYLVAVVARSGRELLAAKTTEIGKNA
jgi:uroporphyrinogen-III synthase